MNKSCLLLLILLFLSPAGQARLHVFACEPEWASLITELAGDRASVFTATTAHQDVHHIQARPSLIAQVRRADLVVCTGAELELGWLPMLLRRARTRAYCREQTVISKRPAMSVCLASRRDWIAPKAMYTLRVIRISRWILAITHPLPRRSPGN